MYIVIAHTCSHYSAFKLQTEMEERGRRAGRWNRDEGMKVAKFLGEKSLMKESFEGSAELKVDGGVFIKKKTLRWLSSGWELAVVENVDWILPIPRSLCHSRGVTWSQLRKQRTETLKAVGWAVSQRAAEAGRRQRRLIRQSHISWKYDWHWHVLFFFKSNSNLQELLGCQDEIIQSFFRYAGGACGEPSEKEMGSGSPGGAAQTVGDGSGEQSLQHLYNKERRSVHVWNAALLIYRSHMHVDVKE